MYGKPAITCFKYQVVLYGLKAFTYLNAVENRNKLTLGRLDYN